MQFVAGRPIETVDMFRLGLYQVNQIRPVLVKVRTVWDCCRLVIGASNLKNHGSRVYLTRDEPLTVRRKNIMEIEASSACYFREQIKLFSVKDDKLIVDGITVYSVSQGRINGNATDTHGSV